jgi:hypothetical protein
VCSVALSQGGTAPDSSKKQQPRLTPRILVAAHTNVAVDRVLLGLQEAGFTNMLRVGSLARIAKRLLGVSLHSAGGWAGLSRVCLCLRAAGLLAMQGTLVVTFSLCLCGVCMCVLRRVVFRSFRQQHRRSGKPAHSQTFVCLCASVCICMCMCR